MIELLDMSINTSCIIDSWNKCAGHGATLSNVKQDKWLRVLLEINTNINLNFFEKWI